MPIVDSANGRLEGRLDGDVINFRGVPFAAPPVGELRWRPPAPVAAWTGVRDATAFGPACLQKVARRDPERGLRAAPQSEDCLALNIWAPASANRLPVMVWIHGGSFRFGAGSLSSYDGRELAKQGVIVVTINYRLGLFGVFAHPALRESGQPDGNYGLLDCVAALKWVNDNIASFGGDPGGVTLFGESAGGVSTGYLMASPLAEGLFQRAIIQSGGLSIPEYSRSQAEAVAVRVAERLGATDAQTLRASPAEAIRDCETAAPETMPFVDGVVIREKARKAFEAGRIHSAPLLIGSNDAEAGFFGPDYWRSLPSEIGDERWRRLRAACFGYGEQSDDACAQQVASELFAGVNTRAMSRGASAVAPVYAYRFSWLPASERLQGRGAIHTAEIPYVFGHVAANADADRRSQEISHAIMAHWVTFARIGRPTVATEDWPPFIGGKDERMLVIGSERQSVGLNPANELLDAIDALSLPARP